MCLGTIETCRILLFFTDVEVIVIMINLCIISCNIFLLCGIDCGEQEKGADPRSDQCSAGSPGGGGAASPGGGAPRGGAGGAVSPDPQGSLEPGPGEPVADPFQPGAHADSRRRRTAGGEMRAIPTMHRDQMFEKLFCDDSRQE